MKIAQYDDRSCVHMILTNFEYFEPSLYRKFLFILRLVFFISKNFCCTQVLLSVALQVNIE